MLLPSHPAVQEMFFIPSALYKLPYHLLSSCLPQFQHCFLHQVRYFLVVKKKTARKACCNISLHNFLHAGPAATVTLVLGLNSSIQELSVTLQTAVTVQTIAQVLGFSWNVGSDVFSISNPFIDYVGSTSPPTLSVGGTISIPFIGFQNQASLQIAAFSGTAGSSGTSLSVSHVRRVQQNSR